MNSSNEEIVLSPDSKALFVERCVKFLMKIESTWSHEIKEQAPKLTLLYCSRHVRSSHWRCYRKKLLLKFLKYPQETSVLESLFQKAGGLIARSFIKKKLQHHRCFPAVTGWYSPWTIRIGVPTRIVFLNRIVYLNNVNHIVRNCTITSFKTQHSPDFGKPGCSDMGQTKLSF